MVRLLGGIKSALDALDGNAAMDELNENGCTEDWMANGQEVTLFKRGPAH